MRKIWMIGLCCLMLAACASKSDTETSATPSTLPEATVATIPETTMSPETTVPETQESTAEPVSFTLYAPDDSLEGFIETEVEVEELTALAVGQKLIEAGVLNENVRVNSRINEGTNLRLDMNAAFHDQLVSFGSTGERFFMGSVVNTFLSAFEAETVSITVNGEVLESGHVVYDFPMEFFE